VESINFCLHHVSAIAILKSLTEENNMEPWNPISVDPIDVAIRASLKEDAKGEPELTGRDVGIVLGLIGLGSVVGAVLLYLAL
jgi:hypothetical protein